MRKTISMVLTAITYICLLALVISGIARAGIEAKERRTRNEMSSEPFASVHARLRQLMADVISLRKQVAEAEREAASRRQADQPMDQSTKPAST